MSSDHAIRLIRIAFLATAWAFVACLVVQLFLVGLDLFEVTGDDVGIHREFAYVYGWGAPALVLLAAAGRVPRRHLAWTVALLVLFSLQTYLPLIAEELPLLGAVHAVNALLVVWLAVHVALIGRELAEPNAHSGGP
jgi:hypothetical protein